MSVIIIILNVQHYGRLGRVTDGATELAPIVKLKLPFNFVASAAEIELSLLGLLGGAFIAFVSILAPRLYLAEVCSA